LFALGIIGEYLARMHFRLMDRPSYAVRYFRDHRAEGPVELHPSESDQESAHDGQVYV
jgi:hypothetical protein